MTQSVYKRDFRDPRDLWKFLLNGNEKSNFEDNEGVERDSKAFEELSIKNCYHNKAKKVERTQSDFIINNSKENETMSEKSTTNLPAASKVRKRNLHRKCRIVWENYLKNPFSSFPLVKRPEKIQNIRFSHHHRTLCRTTKGIHYANYEPNGIS